MAGAVPIHLIEERGMAGAAPIHLIEEGGMAGYRQRFPLPHIHTRTHAPFECFARPRHGLDPGYLMVPQKFTDRG